MIDVSTYKSKKKELGITFEELSQLSGVPVQTLHNIFRGHTTTPRIDTVQAIERALGLESPRWTEEEREQGITDTVSRKLTVEEDDMLSLYREIEQKKGANAQALARKILEQILNS